MLRMYSATALLLLCAACAPRVSNLSSRAGDEIVHGHTVRASDVPAQSVVALVEETEGGSQALCTGTLIDDDTVLTAAHCVREAAKMIIVFGRRLDGDDILARPVTAKRVHPQADLATMHFRGGVPEGYQPVTFAQNPPRVDDEVLLIGYGVNNGLKNKGAGTLRETHTSVVEVDGDAIVSDGEKSSACFGDSGGPEFVKAGDEWQQIGVAHAVTDQACDEATIHTDVRPYLDWIYSKR